MCDKISLNFLLFSFYYANCSEDSHKLHKTKMKWKYTTTKITENFSVRFFLFSFIRCLMSAINWSEVLEKQNSAEKEFQSHLSLPTGSILFWLKERQRQNIMEVNEFRWLYFEYRSFIIHADIVSGNNE